MEDSTYITKDGETLDYICWKVYGKTEGIVEQVLGNNSGLAALGASYSSGVKIKLPDIGALSTTTPVLASVLWS